MEEEKIINTETGKNNGANRCPSCGSTDIVFKNIAENSPVLVREMNRLFLSSKV